jgi:hypothetical protein
MGSLLKNVRNMLCDVNRRPTVSLTYASGMRGKRYLLRFFAASSAILCS